MIHHLFPTRRNGFIPRLLHERSIWAMLGIGLALFSFVQVARVYNYFGLTAEVYPAIVVSLTNKDRTTNNLPVLSISTTLEKAAALKAQDMASKGYFAHTSPDGVTPWHWFDEAGYKFIYAGENLAINYTESDAVQSAWLASPTHRANIMNSNFTEMGVATATGNYNGVPTTFVVELFGMPATARAASLETPVSSPVVQTPATTPAPVSTPAKTVAVKAVSAPAPHDVAGESTAPYNVLEETTTFVMAQNNDKTLEPGNPESAPVPRVSWIKQLILKSDKIAGLIVETIIIALIIATAGMVAREYEKHHRKHMAYGALLAVVMMTALFVGRFGIFANPGTPVASAPLEEVSLQ